MTITEDIELPTDEEITVPEVNLSGATLRAGSFHLGKYCESINLEFMLCRQELQDPRKCIKEGKDVTNCSLEFFRKVKNSCLEEFNYFANCIDKSSGDFAFGVCRNTQKVFDDCMQEKLNLKRPGYGYFCRAKVHDSPRPKPPVEEKVIYADTPQALPEDAPRPEAKYGSRWFFLTE